MLQGLLHWDPLHGKLVAEPEADLKSSPFTSLLQYRKIYYPDTHKQVPGRFFWVCGFFPCFSAAESCAAVWTYLVYLNQWHCCPVLQKWKWKSSCFLNEGRSPQCAFFSGIQETSSSPVQGSGRGTEWTRSWEGFSGSWNRLGHKQLLRYSRCHLL